MAQRLRVGVVGLGARWRRHYRPALAALADRYAVAAVTDPSPRRAAAAAAGAAGLALLAWCAAVLGRPPAAAHGLAVPADGHAAWRLDFAGTVAQLVTWPGAGRRGTARLRVVGERGAAEAVLPGRVR